MSNYENISDIIKRVFTEKIKDIWFEPFKAEEMCRFDDAKKCELANITNTLCIDICVISCCLKGGGR